MTAVFTFQIEPTAMERRDLPVKFSLTTGHLTDMILLICFAIAGKYLRCGNVLAMNFQWLAEFEFFVLKRRYFCQSASIVGRFCSGSNQLEKPFTHKRHRLHFVRTINDNFCLNLIFHLRDSKVINVMNFRWLVEFDFFCI